MNSKCYSKLSLYLLMLSVVPHRANALPQAATVVHGDVSISADNKTMAIRASDRAIVNFRNFNISRDEVVSFLQPGSSAQVLGRITDGNPSQIFGRLNANGRVVLANSSGIYFNTGSVINVGGLIAAAGKISDLDFKSGRNLFTELKGQVVNNGAINASTDVHLIGTTVANSGLIKSQTGLVSLSVGNEILVGERGGNVFISNNPASTSDQQKDPNPATHNVTNTGVIHAPRVHLGAGDLYASSITHTGGIYGEEVKIQAGANGKTQISGVIDASSKTARTTGGLVEITGDQVALKGATIIANGESGGGQVFVGGGWQGTGDLPHSTSTTMDASSLILVNALHSGPGGKVVLWSDAKTLFDGNITACAAGANQEGGHIETSGKISLSVENSARVTTQTPNGATGQWLLDPTNLTIDASGTGTLTGAGDQIVSATAINNAGASVTLSATQDVIINQPISMTVSGVGLNVNAGRNLWIKSAVSTKNGAITMIADNDRNGTGWFKLDAGASLSTAGNSITLTVDHATAVSSDGIDILGNLDTRISTTSYTRVISTIQLLGTNTTGAINIGPIKAELGQDRFNNGTYGELVIKADEINFTGGLNSFRGSGAIRIEQANAATGVKLLSTNDSTPNQLDLSSTDLGSISSDFIGLYIGRIDSTAALVIGDAGSTQTLVMDRGVGGGTFVRLRSGALGITSLSPSKFLNTSYVDLTGNVLLVSQPMSVPSGPVSIAGLGNIDTEITEGTATPGVLQLRPSQLKFLADSSAGLAIGNEGAVSSTKITIKDAITLSSIAGTPGGNFTIRNGGILAIQAPIDAGVKALSLFSAELQFAPGVTSQIKGNNNLWIGPSTGVLNAAAVRDMEVYSGGAAPTGSLLKVLNEDLTILAGNFTGTMVLGRGGQMKGGIVRISGPIDLRGKLVSALDLNATDTLLINAAVDLGLNRNNLKQAVTLQGREIDISPASGSVSGLGNLTIQPVANSYQTVNPINRPVIVGASANDPSGLTITSDDYAKLGNNFQKIYIGRSGLTGDLTFRDSPFLLKADTELLCLATVAFQSSMGGSTAADGLTKSLWVRSLELNINQPIHDLAALQINIIHTGQTGGRKIIVNGETESLSNPTKDMSMDLTRSDLSQIQSATVASLIIGYDGQNYAASSGATSNAAIEVEANWLLPTNTELRSSNQIFVTSPGTPSPTPVYGSIQIKGKIDGGGFNLRLISDSNLALNGGFASISNVNTLTIAPFSRSIEVRLLDAVANANALVLSPQTYAALGSNIQNLSFGRADGFSNLTLLSPLTLLANTTFNAGANVIISEGVDGNNSLTMIAGGITSLAKSIGAITPLKDLTINYGRRTGEKTLIGTPGGPAIKIRTSGNQQFSEGVEMQSPCTFEAVGMISFSMPLAAGIHDLNLFANELFLNGGNGSITGTGNLSIGAGTPETPIVINSTNLTDTPFQLDLTSAKLQAFAPSSFRSITIGRPDGSGDVNISENLTLARPTIIQSDTGALIIEKLVDGAQSLSLKSGVGAIQIKGALGSAVRLGALSIFSSGATDIFADVTAESLFTDAGGVTTLSCASIITNAFQHFGAPVLLTKNATLTSLNSGEIRLNEGISGNFDLRINTAGTTVLKGSSMLNLLETDAEGRIELGGNISTQEAQIYGETATLTEATTLTGASVQFHAGIAGGGNNLTINGDAQLDQTIAGVNELVISGETRLGAGIVSTSGPQTYLGAVKITQDAKLESLNGGDISLNKGVFGAFQMMIVTDGRAQISGPSSLNSLNVESAQGTFLSGDVLTTEGQLYKSPVSLSGNTQLQSSGNGALTLMGAVSGDFDLNLDSDGLIDLRDMVRVNSLSTTNRGHTRVSADIITAGGQSFGNPIEVSQGVLFKSENSAPLLFDAPIDGSSSIVMASADRITLKGNVGDFAKLQSLSVFGKEIEIAGVSVRQNLTLESAQTLTLTGDHYLASERVIFNRNTQPQSNGESTIIKQQGDLTLEGATFLMGQGQKFIALTGGITMRFANAELGDIAASKALLIDIPNVNLLSRPSSPIQNHNIPDNGLSFVSPKITFNGQATFAEASQGPKETFWNTEDGALGGANNLRSLSGSHIAPQRQLILQFAGTSARGLPLQPIAVPPKKNPPVVPPQNIPPPILPISLGDSTGTPFGTPAPTQSLWPDAGYPFAGIWVRRSLEINGRWNAQGTSPENSEERKQRFLEL